MRPLHLGPDAGLDLLLHLQDFQLALDEAVDRLESFRDRQRFQKRLPLLDFDAEMT